MLVGPPLQQVLVGPPFPERGPGCVSPAPPSGGRKRTRVGLSGSRFLFFSERTSHSRREWKPSNSKAAGSTEQWGDEGDSAGWTTPQVRVDKVLPHDKRRRASEETGASRWREDKARSVRLHRRVRALQNAASFKTLASY